MNHCNHSNFTQTVRLEAAQWEANLSSDTQTRLHRCRYHAMAALQNRITGGVERKFYNGFRFALLHPVPTSLLAGAILASLLFFNQQRAPSVNLITAEVAKICPTCNGRSENSCFL